MRWHLGVLGHAMRFGAWPCVLFWGMPCAGIWAFWGMPCVLGHGHASCFGACHALAFGRFGACHAFWGMAMRLVLGHAMRWHLGVLGHAMRFGAWPCVLFWGMPCAG